MIKLHLPLQLRTIEAGVDCEVQACGDGCLLHGYDSFVAVIPGGMGRDTKKLVGDNLLFRTRRGTIIKRRKHIDSSPSVMFGLTVPFDQHQQTVAFDLLRQREPRGVSLPREECSCSCEFDYHDGEVVCPKTSMHAPLLAQKYRVHAFANRTEAVQFLHDAWAILTSLHLLGIRHGDPTHYNFVVNNGSLHLIDLDDTIFTDQRVSGWDLSIFFLHCAAPVLGEYYSADGISTVLREVTGEAWLAQIAANERAVVEELLRVALWQSVELHRSIGNLREIQTTHQAGQIHANDLHRRFLALHDQLGERDRELAERAQQLKEREAVEQSLREAAQEQEHLTQSLRQAAEERLHLVDTLTAQTVTLHAQLAERERVMADLEAQAEARLRLVKDHEANGNRLQEELKTARERLETTQQTELRLQDSQAALETAQTQLRDVSAARTQLDGDLQAQVGICAQLKAELQQASEARERLDRELQARAGVQEQLRAELQALTASGARLERDLQQQTAARVRLIEEHDKEVSRLQEQLQRTEAGVRQQLQREDGLRAQLQLAEERLLAAEEYRTQMALLQVQQAQQAEREAVAAARLTEQSELVGRLQDEVRGLHENSEATRQDLLAVAEARLRVIEEQGRALEAFRRAQWRDRFKRWTAPRLGVLYQYNPRPLLIPEHYYKARSSANSPRISIVTPTFNQGQFIERTIKSVLDQEYPRLEYIVQDGASSDETLEILERYSHRLAHVASGRDKGFVNAINLGFEHSSGEIMAYLNSDDLLLPGALHYVADYFAKHPKVDVVYGHRVVIDEYDAEIGRWVLPPHDAHVLSWADYVPQETLFWRRRLWDEIGGRVDEGFRFAVDWDLLIRLRDAGARFTRLPRFLGAFRVHPHQKTSAEITDIGEQEMARIRERCNGAPVSHALVYWHVRSYLRRHIVYNKLYRSGFLRY